MTLAEQIAKAGAAVEIVLATPQQVERYRDSFCLVSYPALREGKVIYDPAAPRSTTRASV